MSDIKLHSVPTLKDLRPAEQKTTKQPVAPGQWERTLESAMKNVTEVETAVDSAAPKMETKTSAIQDEFRDSNVQFQKMMRAKQDLAMLYQNMNKTDKS